MHFVCRCLAWIQIQIHHNLSHSLQSKQNRLRPVGKFLAAQRQAHRNQWTHLSHSCRTICHVRIRIVPVPGPCPWACACAFSLDSFSGGPATAINVLASQNTNYETPGNIQMISYLFQSSSQRWQPPSRILFLWIKRGVPFPLDSLSAQILVRLV